MPNMRIDAPEPQWQIRLRRADGDKLERALEHLLPDDGAAIYLISCNGQELAAVTRDSPADRHTLSSLSAGTLAAASGLAQALSHDGPQRVLLWGRRQCVVLAPVGRRALMLLVLKRGVQGKMADRRLDRAVLILEDILSRTQGETPVMARAAEG